MWMDYYPCFMMTNIEIHDIPNPDKPEISNIKNQIPNKTQIANHNKQNNNYQEIFVFV